MEEPSAPVLTLPTAEPTQFERNFIKTAVCELRFPALLEFETNDPIQLQKALRKDFPHYDRQRVGLTEADKETRHLLRSKKGHWLVSIKSASIALETSRYTNFHEFSEQLKMLIDKSRPFLDTDFFTRVGLRYINEIRMEDGRVDGWVREELIAPIMQGVYGTVERFLQEVRGNTKSGKYTFRHGIAGIEQERRELYTIDFDFYNENVEIDSVLPMVNEFNHESFRFFLWAIGPKVQDRLGNKITSEKGLK